MKVIDQFKNKKVLVLGLAKSGESAARLLDKLGAIVTVNDFFCPRAVNDSTLGFTLILSPSGAAIFAIYVEFDDPTLVTVL